MKIEDSSLEDFEDKKPDWVCQLCGDGFFIIQLATEHQEVMHAAGSVQDAEENKPCWVCQLCEDGFPTIGNNAFSRFYAGREAKLSLSTVEMAFLLPSNAFCQFCTVG